MSRQAQPILNRGKLRSEEAPLTSSPDARYDFNLTEPGSEAPVDGPLLTMGIVSLNTYEVGAFEEPCVFSGLATMQQKSIGKIHDAAEASLRETNLANSP